jgi:hypothetical protein
MITRLLLQKLLDIEKAVGRGDPMAVRTMVMEAEECVLQMEREFLDTLSENERLRRAA